MNEFYDPTVALAQIATQTVARCAATGAPVSTTVIYRSTAPLEVELSFLLPTGSVEWVFARSLIADALVSGHAGEGDVRIERNERAGSLSGELILHLRGAQSSGSLLFQENVLAQFVRETSSIIPLGQERVVADLDAELRDLLS